LAEKAVPENLDPYYAVARTLFLKWKDFPRATRYLQRYLSQEAESGSPGLQHAHWRLGLVYEKLNRRAEAIAELETAVRMAPDEELFKKDLQRLK
jgi:tetratricopeptide (TPR) repeat protein